MAPHAACNTGTATSPRELGERDPGAGDMDHVACEEVDVTDVSRPDIWAATDALMHLRFRGRESLTPLGRPREREGPTLQFAGAEVACGGEGDRSTSSDKSEATLPGGGG